MTAVIGLSSKTLIDRDRFETLRAHMGEAVFQPALKEVVRQLWKLAREVIETEEVPVLRRRVKQILVIAERFGLTDVAAKVRPLRAAAAAAPVDGFPPSETAELWEAMRDALWETQALIESGALAAKTGGAPDKAAPLAAE
ncbi:MAG: hypothetical protein RIB45_08495 [Marivibrio sp.]|uniref:hypothetical protein n=1 Tax=Marivibrio sp. TaxID=2039719 RepID=UPI0032ED55E7